VSSLDELVRTVWDYHQLGHALVRSDCIFVLGSHDLRVAERAADLYREGLAPLVVFSGGLGRLTSRVWKEPEAVQFARVARHRGVPESAILVESESTNTGENVRLTRRLLEARGVAPQSFILVQKPYMERRAWATFRKVWPEKTVLVTSPRVSLADYPTDDIPREELIHIMVGDLQRIRVYADLGFQIAQEIPAEVWRAYETLVELGYTRHLVDPRR
jgi:uncharacterized SAM-binding protein YcdF (DUF218 family)